MIQVYTDFKSLHTIWDESYQKNNLHVPFLTYLWHQIYFETIGKQFKPLMLYIDDLSIIAPFCTLNNQIYFSGGYEVSDYLDIIGPPKNKYHAWELLHEYFQKNSYLHIDLTNIAENSETLSFFRNLPNTKIEIEDVIPQVKIPKTQDEFLMMLSRKNRHELQRKIRKFEKDHPLATIKTYPANEKIQNFIALMRLNEQKKLFLTDDMISFFTNISASFKTSWIQLVEENSQILSAIWYFIIDDTVYLYNSGINEILASGAGFYIKAKHLLFAIDQHLNHYNFLQGNERYKYELGGIDQSVWKIYSSLK